MHVYHYTIYTSNHQQVYCVIYFLLHSTPSFQCLDAINGNYLSLSLKHSTRLYVLTVSHPHTHIHTRVITQLHTKTLRRWVGHLFGESCAHNAVTTHADNENVFVCLSLFGGICVCVFGLCSGIKRVCVVASVFTRCSVLDAKL